MASKGPDEEDAAFLPGAKSADTSPGFEQVNENVEETMSADPRRPARAQEDVPQGRLATRTADEAARWLRRDRKGQGG